MNADGEGNGYVILVSKSKTGHPIHHRAAVSTSPSWPLSRWPIPPAKAPPSDPMSNRPSLPAVPRLHRSPPLSSLLMRSPMA
eukprot:3304768-Prymnesium_polylepis.1